ncbi:DNA polymerase [Motilibacter rhizosphaerae]|uniref:Type-4 uracil-DNA glycosylase n=1 Tax=Motilibacter rhizosphaerae TaxID=598652 RepID=A0A4Q7NQ78_9ACTN|nr:UdgX family uracil-DNA binding protein [Motilibacter rhizosphaerae]RZS87485.1 DNA polymerase [Motilibacter rhizosphaerae]
MSAPAATPPAERPGAQQWVPPGSGLDGLRAAAPACHGCELWEPATQVVFSAGSATARVALVGEQPGDQEDRAGEPFVGPAGRLLDQALEAAGIARGDAYVTNAVKHFRFTQTAPGKRRIHQTPDRVHVEACKPWLVSELAVVDPEVVVCLGATAAKALLGPAFRVTKSRGQLFPRLVADQSDEAAVQAGWLMATIHPSAVLHAGTGTDDAEAARDAAFAGLVEDLKVAAAALA